MVSFPRRLVKKVKGMKYDEIRGELVFTCLAVLMIVAGILAGGSILIPLLCAFWAFILVGVWGFVSHTELGQGGYLIWVVLFSPLIVGGFFLLGLFGMGLRWLFLG
jgi:hypothetical protein